MGIGDEDIRWDGHEYFDEMSHLDNADERYNQSESWYLTAGFF